MDGIVFLRNTNNHAIPKAGHGPDGAVHEPEPVRWGGRHFTWSPGETVAVPPMAARYLMRKIKNLVVVDGAELMQGGPGGTSTMGSAAALDGFGAEEDQPGPKRGRPPGSKNKISG